MKLSISNIAWSAQDDLNMYDFMNAQEFEGLEIAPTRVFSEKPYDKLTEAKEFADNLLAKYNFEISSMQSIWYGKEQRIFGTEQERNELVEYTNKASDFAHSIGCKNLVFGCPKNRSIENKDQINIAIEFFNLISDYAYSKNTIIALEPNPPIYNTNFMNTTQEAIDFVKKVDNKGLKINLDIGTVIYNNETLNLFEDNFDLINHVHISEPNLEPIQHRDLHIELANFLRHNKYDNFISIEVKNFNNLEALKNIMSYTRKVFS